MVKTAGAVIAALGAIISAFALALIPQLGLLAILLAGLGLLAALSAGLGLFVLGVGLSCQGQLILAIVDTAVSGNYLATNKEKHQALALFNSL